MSPLPKVLPAIERAGRWVSDVEVLHLYYAKPLRFWRERLAANPARVEEIYGFHPMWESYLIASELFFALDDGMAFQIQPPRTGTRCHRRATM